jgi:hypothetical protein
MALLRMLARVFGPSNLRRLWDEAGTPDELHGYALRRATARLSPAERDAAALGATLGRALRHHEARGEG